MIINSRRMTALALSTILAAASLTGCGSSSKETEADVDYNSLSVDDLAAGAKEEGEVDSVGMPDTWANWVETWDDITSLYGVEHNDLDMSSAEEISMFKEEGTDATKDIGDVGQQWGPVAEEEGVTLKYKTSYWDSIPDWAKDDDGDWIVAYVGTTTFMTNTSMVPEDQAPHSFQDILDGDYKVSPGDVTTASQAQHAILAAAYAMGGSIDDIQPGLDFWETLAKEGRLDKGDCTLERLESGEIEVGCFWDYNALNYRDACAEDNPEMTFEICVPSDGAVQSGYCSIINANAPHPYSACLSREYILSDEGQINLAKGYATPIRSDVEIPEDVQAKRIDASEYENAVAVQDFDKWTDTCQEIIDYWQENIVPLMN